MFNILTLCLKISVYLGALFAIVVCTFAGPELMTTLEWSAVPEGVGYGIGAVIGVFLASIIFGIPILLLRINANLERAVDLLGALQQPASGRRSGLMESIAPVFVDHALDSLESD